MENDLTQKLLKELKDNNIQQYKAEDFKILCDLGKGTFGIVKKAQLLDELVAIKFLDQVLLVCPKKDGETKEPTDYTKQILNELQAMTRITHSKIPKFYGVLHENTKDGLNLGLIFSFIEGKTLTAYLNENNGKLSKAHLIDLAVQLVEVISELHKNYVIHRDIKPANIMIKPDGTLVLLDFGVSKISDKTCASTQNVRGTIRYMPPDAFIDSSEDGETNEYKISSKFDVWSLGCLISELFTNVLPWSQKVKDEKLIALRLIRKIEFPQPKEFDKKFPDIYEITKACCCIDENKRLTSSELLLRLKKLQ